MSRNTSRLPSSPGIGIRLNSPRFTEIITSSCTYTVQPDFCVSSAISRIMPTGPADWEKPSGVVNSALSPDSTAPPARTQ